MAKRSLTESFFTGKHRVVVCKITIYAPAKLLRQHIQSMRNNKSKEGQATKVGKQHKWAKTGAEKNVIKNEHEKARLNSTDGVVSMHCVVSKHNKLNLSQCYFRLGPGIYFQHAGPQSHINQFISNIPQTLMQNVKPFQTQKLH